MTVPEPKRLRFTSEDDLCLLREVVGHNPLEHPENWTIVQKNIKTSTGKDFAIRTLKDHMMLLISLWKKKSGVEKARYVKSVNDSISIVY